MSATKDGLLDAIDITEVFEELMSNVPHTFGLDEALFVEELLDRKIHLNMGVDQGIVRDIIRAIIKFNNEDKGKPIEERKPITIYIACRGGYVDDGFELISAIKASKTPIRTVVTGYAYSMGFLIAIAGHERYAFEDARYLMHDGSTSFQGSIAKTRDELKFTEMAESRIKDYVISRSNIDSDKYDKQYRVEWYMFAEEARENGFVDKIIGLDCDLDEVI